MVAPADSSQHKAAQLKLRQAQEEFAKRKCAHAEQLAWEAIELDPQGFEARLWMAEHYEQLGEPRKACRLYQDILHLNPEHCRAWEGLEALDPTAAERLHRLRNIAPDPFVTHQRTCPLSDDVGDIEACQLESEEAPVGIPGFGLHPVSDDIAGDIEEAAPQAPVVLGRTGQSAELFCDIEEETLMVSDTKEEGGPAPWEYEQDRPMLEKVRACHFMPRMVEAIREVWRKQGGMDPALNLCAHVERRHHAGLLEAAATAALALGTQVPEILLLPERRMDVLLLQGQPPTIAVPTGVARVMGPGEQTFALGRALHCVRADYLAELHASEIILNRRARLPGDCEETLRDTLAAAANFWRDGLTRDDVERLKKLAHAWELRACLSADRAGLVACRDLAVALLAMARSTARNSEAAATVTAAGYLEQFAGRDAAQLADLPPTELPQRSEPYTAYRMQMLRWWAGTPAAAQWLAG